MWRDGYLWRGGRFAFMEASVLEIRMTRRGTCRLYHDGRERPADAALLRHYVEATFSRPWPPVMRLDALQSVELERLLLPQAVNTAKV